MLQNYLVLPSQRRGQAIEGKEDRFLRKEQVPRIPQNGIFAFKRIPVISRGPSAVIRIAATCVSLSSNSNQNVIYL